jgi:SAM-dependent methyltransferase
MLTETRNPYGGSEDNDSYAFMTYMDACVTKVKARQQTLLDIGCGYGVHTKRALVRGLQVIAFDRYAANIVVFVQEIMSFNDADAQLANLFVVVAPFPGGNTNAPALTLLDNSLDAVLIFQVLHFLSPRDLINGLQCLFKWMLFGAELMTVSASIRHFNWRATCFLCAARTARAYVFWKQWMSQHASGASCMHVQDA